MNIANINDIDKWINIFYGQVLMHGTEEQKERANFVVDYISFLEKQYKIKKCAICGRKFVAKKKNTCCSKECKNKKKKQNASKFYKEHKKEINEKYKEYRQNYRLEHKEEIKEYQKNYRKNGGVLSERK